MSNLSKSIYSYSAAIFLSVVLAACSSTSKLQNDDHTGGKYNNIDLDTVHAQKFDMGRMWTFDNPPGKYFKEAYNFNPSEEWFDRVRKSALRFSSYCSASFVSGDGLIMTNHHCGRESVTQVELEGENFHNTGFFAKTLQDERKVKGLYVDQLMLVKDVTKEVEDAFASGKTEEDRSFLKDKKIQELEDSYSKETGLTVNVVSFYNGSRFSVYGYKRYKDVRLVFAPENSLGFFGGDYDNFTYPRYCLDFTFFRVYEDDKPLKTENFYKWSPKGAVEGQPIFVIGNPGSTNRLKTFSQLEYMRDIEYPQKLSIMNGLVEVYLDMIAKRPNEKEKLQDKLYSFTNSQKVYAGMLDGLHNPVLMARKRDFERKFRAAVDSKPELKMKYGHIWDDIANSRNQMRTVANQLNGYSLNPYFTSDYFYIARDLVILATQLQLPVLKRDVSLQTQNSIDSVISQIYPEDFDAEVNNKLLKIHIDNMINSLGQDHELVKNMFDGLSGNEAVEYVLSKSKIKTKEDVISLAKKGPEAILDSNDPFIRFVIYTEGKLTDLYKKEDTIRNSEDENNQLLGQAVYEVYGTSIPPDATFTLRISDGIVKGYEYNGTLAPAKTTFYGLYNRFYSFNKKSPWDLPERWQNKPAGFDLETPMNFVSTNDIVGGNSGSPVINENAEIVGIAFDGNMESLPGDFIFATETNRSISVDAEGIMESIQDMYHADRLSDELKTGKIPDQFKTSEEQPVEEGEGVAK